MLGEKASDIILERDTIKPIKEYFKHLIAVKHEKFKDEEAEHHHANAEKNKEEKKA